MTLIASISGVRGTLGGRTSEGLNPLSIARFACAYAFWLRGRCGLSEVKVVIGRDARISGDMVNRTVVGALLGSGIDVYDVGYATTPTVEMAILNLKAHGGIVVTASHNPTEWNALKFLNERGEFVSNADGQAILQTAEMADYLFPTVDELGLYHEVTDALSNHIDAILNLPYVDRQAIREAHLKVAIDPINSVGALAVPSLLSALGVEQVVAVNMEMTGRFAHNPEPLPANLQGLSELVVKEQAVLGFGVDPDVDRLAIVCEDGSMFGEEYTLVAVADYILTLKSGATVSNLSSTSALRDITVLRGGSHYTSAVGEVNVVAKMRDVQAVIGGEGNGGVILPDLHYGRDALVGIALFLTLLVKSGKSATELKKQYPAYYMSKNKITLSSAVDPEMVLDKVKQLFASERLNTEDGVRIDLRGGWIHLRRSNTEPIIRVYAEAGTQEQADELALGMVNKVNEIL
jgi:phosphoglucosamine mutase